MKKIENRDSQEGENIRIFNIEFIYLQKHKKRVSFNKLIKHLNELKAVIKSSFEKFASSISYAKSWIRKFMSGYKLCKDLCG